METDHLSLLTFNIGNPSEQRAQRQLQWLAERPEQVLVLTETKASAGCRLLADAFTAAGYTVVFPQPAPGEYGVMIISRVAAEPDGFADQVGYLPARAASALLPTPTGPLRLLGLYVPSRDAGWEKTERKKKWLAACRTALANAATPLTTILMGDLNILEPDHRPRYPFFAPFEYDFYRSLSAEHTLVDAFRHLHPTANEYSWVGRTGDGYRYDHIFCAAQLRKHITHCGYEHQPRHDRLSDHSAMTARIAIPAPATLVTSNPVAATAPDVLF